MIRTIIWFLYFGISLVLTLPMMIRARYLYKKGEMEKLKDIAFRVSRTWARQLVNIAGGKIKVIGMENLPKEESFLIVSNHQSNFDIPILIGYTEIPLAFIAKIETKKIPIVKQWMEYMHCIFMDRNDFRQSVRAINDGAKGLKAGYNYVIFPEGTRSLDGNLGDFKAGSIKMAMKAKSKIVPLSINGTFDMMRKGNLTITPADVIITIHPPIEFSEDNTKLIDKVKDIIEKDLKIS